jgi:predicted naringenin-chalcone synthase
MTRAMTPAAPAGAHLAAPYIAGIASSVPEPMDQAGLWTDFFSRHYAGDGLAEHIFSSSAITTRHGVADPRVLDVSSWSTGQRMARYVDEAPRLGKAALASALAAAGLDPPDVGLFAVVSCTGYSTPGLDLVLARDLGMAPTVQRLHIGHMGCYAALPGLGAVADFVVARQRPAVLLCVELTSLHIQPATDDVAQMVAHALFSDAAAAVVLRPGDDGGGPGLRVVDVVAVADHSTADHMTWDITDLGFRMGLSPQVPAVLARHVGAVVRDRLLAPHRLAPADVTGWAVHPGGRRILEVVEQQLELPSAAMAPSYAVLDRFGNCSSATVLMVLEQLPAAAGPVVAMAFGPGLTLYAALLHST